MHRHHKIFYLIILALTLTLGLQNASAQPSPEEHMAELLGLSQQQIDTINTLRKEQRPDFESERQQNKEIHALIQAGNTEQAAELAAEQARSRVYKQAEFHNKLKQILSEEQLATWEQMPKWERMPGPKHHMRFHNGKPEVQEASE